MDSNKVHALTQGQIEKAAEAAWKRATEHTGWMGLSDRWEEVKEVHRQEWRDIATAVAPHLQYAPAPAQILGDVVEEMIKEFDKKDYSRDGMTAAAQVLLNRALGPVTDHESRNIVEGASYYGMRKESLDAFLLKRRASLLKPAQPTLEQDVAKAVYSVTGTSKPWLEHDMVAAIMEALACRSSGGSHD